MVQHAAFSASHQRCCQEGAGKASRDPWLQHWFIPTGGAARTPCQGKPGCEKDEALSCPRQCPRCCSVSLASGCPEETAAEKRRGEGGEPLSRLTAPTCAAAASPDRRIWLTERVEATLLCVSLYKPQTITVCRCTGA